MSRPAPVLGKGRYAIFQLMNHVVIINAWGQTPTPNYGVWLMAGPETIIPPIYELWWRAPSGPQSEVMTPFRVHTAFRAGGVLRSLEIRDAHGTRTHPVHQIP